MVDEPDAKTLLEAMAATLTDQVVPSCAGGAQHAARVVANLCMILAREMGDDGADLEGLRAWRGSDAPNETLIAEFDAALATSTDQDAVNRALDVLLADAARRAEIARPGYTDHGPT